MRPKIEGKYRIKFKAELLPLKDGSAATAFSIRTTASSA